MTKRKVTKLFAVVALATSTPALAGPASARSLERREPVTTTPAKPDPWASETTPGPAPIASVQLADAVLAVFGISAPRRLPSGAPACGNVASRAPRPVDCK